MIRYSQSPESCRPPSIALLLSIGALERQTMAVASAEPPHFPLMDLQLRASVQYMGMSVL